MVSSSSSAVSERPRRHRFGNRFAAQERVVRMVALAMGLLIAPSMAAQEPPTAKHQKKAAPGERAAPREKSLTEETRRAFIRRAQVWTPANIPAMDLRAGPQGPGALPPNALVTCDYVEKAELPGTSRKFDCAIDPEDVVKVRYGQDNGKVEGEVLASRLLWALGFGA